VIQGELTLVNATQQFHSGNGNRRRREVLESEHGVGTGLDAAVILLDQIVQILRRSQPRASWKQAVGLHFADRAVRGSIAVQGALLQNLRVAWASERLPVPPRRQAG